MRTILNRYAFVGVLVTLAVTIATPAGTPAGSSCRPDPSFLQHRNANGTCGELVPSGLAPAAARACRWGSPPTKSGTYLAAGSIDCAGVRCTFKSFPQDRSPWLGVDHSAEFGNCSDGRHVRVAVYGVALTHPNGKRCQYTVRPNVQFFRAFHVPASWGGIVTVVWELDTFTAKDVPIASQGAIASYLLEGGNDGCALLEQSGSLTLPPP
jgi:hypothetical protein